MEHEAEDGRCTNWNHVWMQGCQTCVENRARQQALLDAMEAVKATACTGQGNAMPPREWVHTPSAVAAIEALGGER